MGLRTNFNLANKTIGKSNANFKSRLFLNIGSIKRNYSTTNQEDSNLFDANSSAQDKAEQKNIAEGEIKNLFKQSIDSHLLLLVYLEDEGLDTGEKRFFRGATLASSSDGECLGLSNYHLSCASELNNKRYGELVKEYSQITRLHLDKFKNIESDYKRDSQVLSNKLRNLMKVIDQELSEPRIYDDVVEKGLSKLLVELAERTLRVLQVKKKSYD